MELSGIELEPQCGRLSPQGNPERSEGPLYRLRVGGAERDRTAGLLVANEALSQLSYSPTTYLVYQ